LAKTAHLSSLLPAEDALEPLSELLQHKQTRLTEIEEYKKQAEQYEANIQKSATHIQSILASPPKDTREEQKNFRQLSLNNQH
jgi:multidrug resistance efflux pump